MVWGKIVVYKCLSVVNIKIFCIKRRNTLKKYSNKTWKDSLKGSLVRVSWLLEGTSTQATSECIKRKHSKYRKIKTTVLWPTSWGTNISSFYCSDVNLFLIDYAWWKLLQWMIALFQEKHQELNTGGKTLLQLLLKIG